ncbi:hypothetical protein EDD18DRAFT_1333860 [Armillaria luteobubalina]|uniref:DUF6534 domain-containing protein n=1 Tax=Armillaria luteobubalina TaxID=153913 RepID=A0AA39Q1I0_9AGAR|nr:hypothetical protein EDD18DRAFT_1333860 [Armillaria luteobubalina]
MQPVPIFAYLLHWGLFGTLSVQLCNLYYLAFSMDRKFTNYLVYGIYIIESAQTMIFTHDAFATFGYGFGDMEALTGMYSNWFTVPIMSVLLSRQVLWRPEDIRCIGVRFCVEPLPLCDVIIAIFMTYYLMRGNTGLRRTQMLVTKLIRLIVETGSATAVVALLSFVLFFSFPHQIFYKTPTVIVAKLYANNVYMVLNSRIRIIGGRDTYTSSTDMSITTTMMRDMTQSTEGTRPADRIQERVSVVVITPEIFDDDHEIGQEENKSHGNSNSLSVRLLRLFPFCEHNNYVCSNTFRSPCISTEAKFEKRTEAA